MLHLLRSHPSIKSIQYHETWCISIAISYRSWLTNHSVQFHYNECANAQITDYALCYKHLQTAIVITKSIYICNGLLNQPSQLIRQYFT